MFLRRGSPCAERCWEWHLSFSLICAPSTSFPSSKHIVQCCPSMNEGRWGFLTSHPISGWWNEDSRMTPYHEAPSWCHGPRTFWGPSPFFVSRGSHRSTWSLIFSPYSKAQGWNHRSTDTQVSRHRNSQNPACGSCLEQWWHLRKLYNLCAVLGWWCVQAWGQGGAMTVTVPRDEVLSELLVQGRTVCFPRGPEDGWSSIWGLDHQGAAWESGSIDTALGSVELGHPSLGWQRGKWQFITL